MSDIINFLGPIFKWIALVCLIILVFTGFIHKKSSTQKISKKMLIIVSVIAFISILIIAIYVLTNIGMQ